MVNQWKNFEMFLRIFKNIYFVEHLWTAASNLLAWKMNLQNMIYSLNANGPVLSIQSIAFHRKLSHFMLLVSFDFLMFLGGTERDQWHEMG